MRARVRVLVPALLALLASTSAQAAVEIDINKDTQTMTVAVDGVTKYRWPVSSGLPAYETPSGAFKAFRLEEDHYSKEWDDAPMPHSIFFTKKGHAIHGTDAAGRLGNPASHGCVRLSRANAAVLFALVKQEGLSNTTVNLSGSAQVALARGPQRRNNDVASRAAPPQPSVEEPQVRMYDGTVRPLPPPQQITPPTVDTGGYYDEYGRPIQRGQTYRRTYQADSYYADQQPYAQQQSPYQPRYYGQQPYQPQYQVQQPYAQPRYYRYEYYGN
jgi:hypothetical protein